jgi:hypothetical protein
VVECRKSAQKPTIPKYAFFSEIPKCVFYYSRFPLPPRLLLGIIPELSVFVKEQNQIILEHLLSPLWKLINKKQDGKKGDFLKSRK